MPHNNINRSLLEPIVDNAHTSLDTSDKLPSIWESIPELEVNTQDYETLVCKFMDNLSDLLANSTKNYIPSSFYSSKFMAWYIPELYIYVGYTPGNKSLVIRSPHSDSQYDLVKFIDISIPELRSAIYLVKCYIEELYSIPIIEDPVDVLTALQGYTKAGKRAWILFDKSPRQFAHK